VTPSRTKTILNGRGAVAAEVTPKDKWVEVATLQIESVEDTKALQIVIERELAASTSGRVLLDARKAALSTPEMNDSMWQWVRSSRHLERLAIINQSSALSVAVRMRAKAMGTKKVAVFEKFQAAARWLVASSDG
jgi:hypothetical protein